MVAVCRRCNRGEIHTLEGIHEVIENDWIIKGVKGELYPCKPDIFEMTYEREKYLKANLTIYNRGDYLLVDINDLRKVKGIGEKTIARIKETLCTSEEDEYVSQYAPNIYLDINNIYLGDRLDLTNGIPDKSIDMILCDLPYGTTQCKWDTVIPFEPLWSQYKRIIKDNGAIVLFGSQPFTSNLIMSNLEWFRYCWVWEKNKATGYLNANKMPLRSYEDIVIFYKKMPTYNPQMTKGTPYSNRHKPNDSGDCYGNVAYSERNNITTRYPRSVIRFNVDMKAEYHPTQKPVPLLEYLIKTYTNENELVLDNCIGSGSTAIAAINTGRNYIGMEKDPEYYKIAKKRIEEHKSTTI